MLINNLSLNDVLDEADAMGLKNYLGGTSKFNSLLLTIWTSLGDANVDEKFNKLPGILNLIIYFLDNSIDLKEAEIRIVASLIKTTSTSMKSAEEKLKAGLMTKVCEMINGVCKSENVKITGKDTIYLVLEALVSFIEADNKLDAKEVFDAVGNVLSSGNFQLGGNEICLLFKALDAAMGKDDNKKLRFKEVYELVDKVLDDKKNLVPDNEASSETRKYICTVLTRAIENAGDTFAKLDFYSVSSTVSRIQGLKSFYQQGKDETLAMFELLKLIVGKCTDKKIEQDLQDSIIGMLKNGLKAEEKVEGQNKRVLDGEELQQMFEVLALSAEKSGREVKDVFGQVVDIGDSKDKKIEPITKIVNDDPKKIELSENERQLIFKVLKNVEEKKNKIIKKKKKATAKAKGKTKKNNENTEDKKEVIKEKEEKEEKIEEIEENEVIVIKKKKEEGKKDDAEELIKKLEEKETKKNVEEEKKEEKKEEVIEEKKEEGIKENVEEEEKDEIVIKEEKEEKKEEVIEEKKEEKKEEEKEEEVEEDEKEEFTSLTFEEASGVMKFLASAAPLKAFKTSIKKELESKNENKEWSQIFNSDGDIKIKMSEKIPKPVQGFLGTSEDGKEILDAINVLKIIFAALSDESVRFSNNNLGKALFSILKGWGVEDKPNDKTVIEVSKILENIKSLGGAKLFGNKPPSVKGTAEYTTILTDYNITNKQVESDSDYVGKFIRKNQALEKLLREKLTFSKSQKSEMLKITSTWKGKNVIVEEEAAEEEEKEEKINLELDAEKEKTNDNTVKKPEKANDKGEKAEKKNEEITVKGKTSKVAAENFVGQLNVNREKSGVRRKLYKETINKILKCLETAKAKIRNKDLIDYIRHEINNGGETSEQLKSIMTINTNKSVDVKKEILNFNNLDMDIVHAMLFLRKAEKIKSSSGRTRSQSQEIVDDELINILKAADLLLVIKADMGKEKFNDMLVTTKAAQEPTFTLMVNSLYNKLSKNADAITEHEFDLNTIKNINKILGIEEEKIEEIVGEFMNDLFNNGNDSPNSDKDPLNEKDMFSKSKKEKSSIMKEEKDFLELIEDRPIIPKNKAKKKPKKPVSFLEEEERINDKKEKAEEKDEKETTITKNEANKDEKEIKKKMEKKEEIKKENNEASENLVKNFSNVDSLFKAEKEEEGDEKNDKAEDSVVKKLMAVVNPNAESYAQNKESKIMSTKETVVVVEEPKEEKEEKVEDDEKEEFTSLTFEEASGVMKFLASAVPSDNFKDSIKSELEANTNESNGLLSVFDSEGNIKIKAFGEMSEAAKTFFNQSDEGKKILRAISVLQVIFVALSGESVKFSNNNLGKTLFSILKGWGVGNKPNDKTVIEVSKILENIKSLGGSELISDDVPEQDSARYKEIVTDYNITEEQLKSDNNYVAIFVNKNKGLKNLLCTKLSFSEKQKLDMFNNSGIEKPKKEEKPKIEEVKNEEKKEDINKEDKKENEEKEDDNKNAEAEKENDDNERNKEDNKKEEEKKEKDKEKPKIEEAKNEVNKEENKSEEEKKATITKNEEKKENEGKNEKEIKIKMIKKEEKIIEKKDNISTKENTIIKEEENKNEEEKKATITKNEEKDKEKEAENENDNNEENKEDEKINKSMDYIRDDIYKFSSKLKRTIESATSTNNTTRIDDSNLQLIGEQLQEKQTEESHVLRRIGVILLGLAITVSFIAAVTFALAAIPGVGPVIGGVLGKTFVDAAVLSIGYGLSLGWVAGGLGTLFTFIAGVLFGKNFETLWTPKPLEEPKGNNHKNVITMEDKKEKSKEHNQNEENIIKGNGLGINDKKPKEQLPNPKIKSSLFEKIDETAISKISDDDFSMKMKNMNRPLKLKLEDEKNKGGQKKQNEK